MSMELIIELLIMLVFLGLKGFFSGSEIAMVNSDKLKLRHRAKQGDRGAGLVLKLFQTPDVILGTHPVGYEYRHRHHLDHGRADLHRPVRCLRGPHLSAVADALSADLR